MKFAVLIIGFLLSVASGILAYNKHYEAAKLTGIVSIILLVMLLVLMVIDQSKSKQ